MPGQPVPLGPFTSGMHNSSGTSDYLDNNELFDIINLEIDTDGSLVNRPAIKEWVVTGSVITKDVTVIGTYMLPSAEYIVICGKDVNDDYHTEIVDRDTGAVWKTKNIRSRVSVQYRNNLFVISNTSGVNGGYFSSGGSWTDIATMPTGEDALIFMERLWVVSDDTNPLDNSRIFFSPVGAPESTWSNLDYFDIDAGDGSRLTCAVVLMNDLILFKEHSTYRLSMGANIAKAQVIKLDDRIGSSGPRCIDVTTSNVYVLHKESIYEMFNYSYKKISSQIALPNNVDSDQRAWESKALVAVGERLLVRYNEYLYSYNAEVKGGWTRWDSKHNIAAPKLLKTDSDVFMYGNSDRTNENTLYFIKDNRSDGVGTDEEFKCFIETKTYDFDNSWAYKVLFWWGTAASTSTDLIGRMNIRVQFDVTWDYLNEGGVTWDMANAELITWGGSGERITISTRRSPGVTSYSRKFYKFFKKVRFRQASFQLETEALRNIIADSAVRFYDLTAFVDVKERVVKEVS